jgi:hypothetical protein
MSDEEIEELVRLFEDATLPRSEWTHGKHLIVALFYLVRLPRAEATIRIREGILRLNHHNGNLTGYHETITLAWIAVIARFLEMRHRSGSLSILTGELLEECGVKDYLLRFYSREVQMSDEARRSWVPPDLRPMD